MWYCKQVLLVRSWTHVKYAWHCGIYYTVFLQVLSLMFWVLLIGVRFNNLKYWFLLINWIDFFGIITKLHALQNSYSCHFLSRNLLVLDVISQQMIYLVQMYRVHMEALQRQVMWVLSHQLYSNSLYSCVKYIQDTFSSLNQVVPRYVNINLRLGMFLCVSILLFSSILCVLKLGSVEEYTSLSK